MGTNTKIEWTDATWNPGQGCTKVDGDCKFCYMYREKERYGQDPTTVVRSAPATFNSILNPSKFPPGSRVFTASWSDWWHEGWDPFRDEALALVDRRRDVTFQILTKRIERVAGTLPGTWGPDGWPHVWLGTSVGSPAGAKRARALAELSAVVRFLSIEPLWAPGVADAIRDVVESGRIDWIILGGESGPHARPMFLPWAREIRDLAIGAKVPIILKQWGEWSPAHLWEKGEDPATGRKTYAVPNGTKVWYPNRIAEAEGRPSHLRVGKKAAGRTLDGVIHDEYPLPRVASPLVSEEAP